MNNKVLSRLKKQANAIDIFRNLIDNNEISEDYIVSVFETKVENWGERYIENLGLETIVPYIENLIRDFSENVDMHSIFDSIFEGEVEPHLFDEINDNQVYDLIDYIVNKYDIYNNYRIYSVFEGIYEGIAEVLDNN